MALKEEIAKKHLLIDTLQTQHRDQYDFHDVSIWGVAAALEAAYQAGIEFASKQV